MTLEEFDKEVTRTASERIYEKSGMGSQFAIGYAKRLKKLYEGGVTPSAAATIFIRDETVTALK